MSIVCRRTSGAFWLAAPPVSSDKLSTGRLFPSPDFRDSSHQRPSVCPHEPSRWIATVSPARTVSHLSRLFNLDIATGAIGPPFSWRGPAALETRSRRLLIGRDARFVPIDRGPPENDQRVFRDLSDELSEDLAGMARRTWIWRDPEPEFRPAAGPRTPSPIRSGPDSLHGARTGSDLDPKVRIQAWTLVWRRISSWRSSGASRWLTRRGRSAALRAG